MIFQFLDEASNASNARVCKQWSELALDTLWKEVSDLHRLFSLLSPLESMTGGQWAFARPLESSDWRRFERYRRRIRSLSYRTSDAARVLHQSVFDDIARSRTSLDILPSLHSLEWDAPLHLCVIFMHKTVKSFAFRLSEDTPGVNAFFEDTVTRMPNLRDLDIRLNFSIRSIERPTIMLLSSLSRLQKLTLPRFCLTTKIAESLSRLQNLECIEFQYFERQGRGEPDDIVDFRPSLTEGSFPSLWDLSITVSFTDAIRFFNASFAPANLTSLYLDSSITETPADVLNLITVVAENCQLLKALGLVSSVDASTVATEPPDRDDCITIDTLRPLLKCPNLTSFDLVHHYPLHLEQTNIEEIASSWPGLETLVLNNEPAYLDHASLTLRSLLPFARHCPKLRKLGLFLNATTADLAPSTDRASSYEHPPFRALRRLSMGVSNIHDAGAVALFLSEICPLQCTIDCGVTWDDSITVASEIVEAIQRRCEKWEKVVEHLPMLTKLRMEERERARRLKEEVEDLRIRTGVLMDKAVVGSASDGCVAI
ncbi:hypothetical protein LshimejAT787_0600270 [Lyophyllum shimeji]|uniref:F-box domain-containing protein n=1 Tax=Lyophyllum shimeji TaxID=47721 RepID=A0A9P3PM47_LYOSH|nr:hypothetical protein LshimejAT787_0600270 [Lyophyllum shimeji]